MKLESERLDHRVIAGLIPPRSTVLDLGCGTGELLYLLVREKGVRGQGVEIDEQAIYKCVAKGLNVLHGDLDSGLSDYLDNSFDYVILNQCLQQVRHVETIFKDSLRVGKRVVVGFPNFAHYTARLQLGLKGRAPVTASLPYEWFDTPNLHFLSIADFYEYCRKKGVKMERAEFIGNRGLVRLLPNLFAETGIFLISG
jgi:methionine biosynthesis protein MetW